MALSRVHCAALAGIDAVPVGVEVDVQDGLPSFCTVGLPDAAVREAQVARLACSSPPDGRATWTLRLLADRVVELGYVDSLSHESVRQVLKKTNSSPG